MSLEQFTAVQFQNTEMYTRFRGVEEKGKIKKKEITLTLRDE